MKKIPKLKSFGLSLAALALLGFVNSGQAQFTPNVDSYANAFDASTDTASWFCWYNWTYNVTQNPDVYNPATAGNAGSMELDLASPWAQPTTQQGILMGTFGNQAQWDQSVSINANLYTNIIFDVLVNSNCAVNPNGNFGGYYVGFMTPGNTMVQVGFVSMPAEASNHWVHCVLPISKTVAGDISSCWGLYLQSTHWWDTDPSTPPSGGLTNYIDNLEVEITPGPPPPAPTLLSSTMKKAVAGVTCIGVDSGSSAIDNRYSIVTTNTTGYGPNSGDTVTYAWNIASFPNDPNGFQSHFFISCGTDSSTTNANGGPGPYDTAVDWNWGNVIRLTVQANAGSAYMNFTYKTNEPNGMDQVWASNYCTVSSSTAVGTWSVSFNRSSGLVTMTSPTATTNFTMDIPSLALFTDPLALTLGGQPNDLTGEGQSVAYSSFSATGCATPISDNFATDAQLNTNIWFVLASDANGIQFAPPTAGLWLAWTRPDSGFSPQGSTNLASSFTDITPITTLLNMGNRMILVPSANVGAGQSFYRLIKRSFTKLQILLPGETAAPNTVSGKTGTPIAQTANTAFNVIVNAVDDNWNVINGANDTIDLTSTDGSFFVSNTPTDLALVNGTTTFSVIFLADGSGTITATDVTDTSKTAATSATATY
jgi:hypothetical protein